MGYTILVVEDFSDARDLMRLVLETEGYRVIEAGNGIDAVETAQREHPDAILMDMSMPFMDGCQATKRIRQSPSLSNIPIILHRSQPMGVAQQSYLGRLHRFLNQAPGDSCAPCNALPLSTNVLGHYIGAFIPALHLNGS